MKKTLFAMLLMLACLTGAQGQRFEWAKGYASAQQGSEIKGTVADREGNLYILGTFRNDARWDGEPLLPMTPYGRNHDNTNVLIAKISPSGQMLWKKVIHGNNGYHAYARDIKPVGDTAFACLVEAVLPVYALGEYCYYLDTLLTELGGYPIAPFEGAWMNGLYTILIVFDLSGEVLEQHCLKITYTDSLGNDIVTQVGSNVTLDNHHLRDPSFDIDAEGNIYLSRMAYDYIDAERCTETGVIQGLKFWDNHRLVGTVRFADKPLLYNIQLLVFSPHFDTLLASRYLFQQYVGNIPSAYLRLDRYGDLYALGSIPAMNIDDTVVVYADRGLSFPITMANHNKGYLVKLDSALTPLYCVTLEDSIRNGDILTSSRSYFNNIYFDTDSGLCFVNGFIQRDHGTTALVTFNGVPTGIEKNDAFVISFHMESGDMHSLAVVPSIRSSHLGSSDVNNNLAASNNRIFMQNSYYGGVRYPNDTTILSGNNPSLGLSVFDYKGNSIEGHDFGSTSPLDRPGSLSLVDSVLYMSNLFVSSASFGDIVVPAQGYHACIAKYVDTVFMTPYRAAVPADTDTVSIVHPDYGVPQTSVHPNPATDALYVSADGGSIGSVAAISVLGIRHPLPFIGNVVDVSSLAPGVYIIEIIINNIKSNLKFIKL